MTKNHKKKLGITGAPRLCFGVAFYLEKIIASLALLVSIRPFFLYLPEFSFSTVLFNNEGNIDGIKVYSSPIRGNNETAAICTIVKNETIYLDEWVDYHIALGFASIFIYDNSESPDAGLMTWLNSRNDLLHYVKVTHFPDQSGKAQPKAYDRCIKGDARNHTFVSLFDPDEFLVLKKHDNVMDFLADHCDETCGEISIHWQLMGHSNATNYLPLPVTKRFVYADSVWTTVKPILRPSYAAENLNWLHGVDLKKGLLIDTDGREIEGKRRLYGNDSRPSDVALFYHYKTKSLEELHYKTCVRGDVQNTNYCNQRQYLYPEPRGRNYSEIQGTTSFLVGKHFDDTAWTALKRMVPKYRHFDSKS